MFSFLKLILTLSFIIFTVKEALTIQTAHLRVRQSFVRWATAELLASRPVLNITLSLIIRPWDRAQSWYLVLAHLTSRWLHRWYTGSSSVFLRPYRIRRRLIRICLWALMSIHDLRFSLLCLKCLIDILLRLPVALLLSGIRLVRISFLTPQFCRTWFMNLNAWFSVWFGSFFSLTSVNFRFRWSIRATLDFWRWWRTCTYSTYLTYIALTKHLILTLLQIWQKFLNLMLR